MRWIDGKPGVSLAGPRGARVVVAVGVGSLLVFVADLFTPLGFAHGVLYLPLVLLAVASRRPGVVVATGLSCSLLLGLGYRLSPVSDHLGAVELAVFNRWMALLMVVACVGFSLFFLHLLRIRDRAVQASQQARDALEAEQQLRKIACEAGRLGGWRVLLDEQRLFWSDEVAAIHGMPAGYSPGVEAAIGFYVEGHATLLRSRFEACARDGTPYDEELQIRNAQGEKVWVRAIGRAVRDANGRITQVQGAFQDITERRGLELSLQSSERWFKDVARNIPVFLWAADAAGRINYVSPRLAEFSGMEAGRIATEEGWAQLLHPDDLEAARELWLDCVASRQPYAQEFRLRAANGEYHWHLVQAMPTLNEDGSVERWVGSVADIQQNKHLEREAHKLASRLTTTLQSITDGFFLVDRSWCFSFVNRRAEEMLGLSAPAALGRSCWDLIPELREGSFAERLRLAMESGVAQHFTERTGSTGRWLTVHAFPSVEGLAVYFQDITEQRAAEAQLRLLEAAVTRINDIVIITEADPLDAPGPRIVYANPAFERCLGYQVRDIIGKSPRLLQGEGTSRDELDRIRKALEDAQPIRAQLLNYARDGRELTLEIEIAPIPGEDGKPSHFVAIERDISERMELERRLRHAQRMESIGQLSGGMAHDFNNLLTVVMGNAEVLVESLAGEPRPRRLAAMIVDAAERASTLVQRLLAYARQQALEPRVVAVDGLVAGMLELLRRTLGTHIELGVSQVGHPPKALVDPGQLESALLNLCINARDAMPGGGRLEIAIRGEELAEGQVGELPPGHYVVIDVKDTGAGIAPDDIYRVFEPFFTTKGRTGGTGLGLSMVYGFARQSSGHVAISSVRNEGTTVTLYLPQAPEQMPGRAPVIEVEGPAPAETARILLVEDNDLVRQYATAQLEKAGYRVVEAENAEQALACLEQDDGFDLLFTDILMPGGTHGLELAKIVQARHSDMKVLLTTGYTDQALPLLQDGFELLHKPYRSADLLGRVAAVLGRGSQGGP